MIFPIVLEATLLKIEESKVSCRTDKVDLKKLGDLAKYMERYTHEKFL